MVIDELIEKLSLFFSLFFKEKSTELLYTLVFYPPAYSPPQNATHTAFLYALIQVRNCN